MHAFRRFAEKRVREQDVAIATKRIHSDDASTFSAELFNDDANTERSMRERSVTQRSVNGSSAATLSLSATVSGEHGVVRSAVSSIHLDDPPDPVPALVPPSTAASPNPGCPICREQFQSHFDAHRTARESVDARGAGTMTTARNAKARSAMVQTIANRYQIIFRAESVLRGIVRDEQLFVILLQMHRIMIEKELRDRTIGFVPWTVAMLRVHYHPVRGHVFDKVRLVYNELDRAARTTDLCEEHLLIPDRENPGRQILDTRAVLAMERSSAHMVKLVQILERMQREKEEDLAGAVFALVSIIGKMFNDSSLAEMLRDPRAAAGTTAVGGDTLRSVNVGATTAIGSAYDLYAMSGF